MWKVTDDGNATNELGNHRLITIPSLFKSFYATVAIKNDKPVSVIKLSDSKDTAVAYVKDCVKKFNVLSKGEI